MGIYGDSDNHRFFHDLDDEDKCAGVIATACNVLVALILYSGGVIVAANW